MSKKDKLIKDLENNSKDVRFETLKKLLLECGYSAYNNGSSHFQFRKEGCEIITIPYKRPVKPIYVKMVLKAIKEQE
ncbi:hypothetical protein B6S12_05035 [Helicobacter valdiviensis]|uniref:Toxin HicA n=1 Tax=Helicobacter valdiviensis TaxID=1458358 RepID=A0A2W6NL81_9HELI|nr:type II toxin-antitoxin system HicA family toxin [Helicobacter valdiviensis]PZT48186.1 hypothetical protein B6S12_05035 [Helicobacter valdiviensis]